MNLRCRDGSVATIDVPCTDLGHAAAMDFHASEHLSLIQYSGGLGEDVVACYALTGAPFFKATRFRERVEAEIVDSVSRGSTDVEAVRRVFAGFERVEVLCDALLALAKPGGIGKSDLERYAAESDVLLIFYDDGARAWIGCNRERTKSEKDRCGKDFINDWMGPRKSDDYDAYETVIGDEKLLFCLATSDQGLDQQEYLFKHFVKRCRWGWTEGLRFPPLDSIDLVVGIHSSSGLLVQQNGWNQTMYEPEAGPIVEDHMCLFARNLLWRTLVTGTDDD